MLPLCARYQFCADGASKNFSHRSTAGFVPPDVNPSRYNSEPSAQSRSSVWLIVRHHGLPPPPSVCTGWSTPRLISQSMKASSARA